MSSGQTKMCSTDREDLGAERTGERREVSEKVCMRRAGMTNLESSDGDFVATGG